MNDRKLIIIGYDDENILPCYDIECIDVMCKFICTDSSFIWFDWFNQFFFNIRCDWWSIIVDNKEKYNYVENENKLLKIIMMTLEIKIKNINNRSTQKHNY